VLSTWIGAAESFVVKVEMVLAQQIEETSTVKEQVTRQRWRWVVIGVFALILGLLVGWLLINFIAPPYTYHGTLIQSPNLANNFTLTGRAGEPVSLSDFRGKAVLIYFGYTFCPDVCPATMVELAKANELLGNDSEKAQVIMISVDPARDTPQKLQEYVTYFDPAFIGITGNEDEIAAAATPFGIYYEKHEGTVSTGYLIDHTASVVVVDPEGYLRLVYSFNTPGEEIAEDIRHLVN
jgi:protein SCO1